MIIIELRLIEYTQPNVNNVRISTATHTAKLSINQGDVYVETIGSGVVTRSPDGKCWKITVNNLGQLSTVSVPYPSQD